MRSSTHSNHIRTRCPVVSPHAGTVATPWCRLAAVNARGRSNTPGLRYLLRKRQMVPKTLMPGQQGQLSGREQSPQDLVPAASMESYNPFTVFVTIACEYSDSNDKVHQAWQHLPAADKAQVYHVLRPYCEQLNASSDSERHLYPHSTCISACLSRSQTRPGFSRSPSLHSPSRSGITLTLRASQKSVRVLEEGYAPQEAWGLSCPTIRITVRERLRLPICTALLKNSTAPLCLTRPKSSTALLGITGSISISVKGQMWDALAESVPQMLPRQLSDVCSGHPHPNPNPQPHSFPVGPQPPPSRAPQPRSTGMADVRLVTTLRPPQAPGFGWSQFVNKCRLAWDIFFPPSQTLSPAGAMRARLKMVLISDRSGLDLPTLMQIRNQSLTALAEAEGWSNLSELELQVASTRGDGDQVMALPLSQVPERHMLRNADDYDYEYYDDDDYTDHEDEADTVSDVSILAED